MKSYYKHWGKSKNLDNGTFNYHFLVYHCLDAVAVGRILIDDHIKRKSIVSQFSKDEVILIRSLFLFFLALHDIGKFSITFQNLNPVLLQLLQKNVINMNYSNRHDYLGWLVYDSEIRQIIYNSVNEVDEIPAIDKILDIFAFFSFGHHGKPAIEGNGSYRSDFLDTDKMAIRDFVADLLKLFTCPVELKVLSYYEKNERKKFISSLKKISWELAALCVISDWLASGDDFRFYSNEIPIEEYLKIADKEAEVAVKRAGILPSRPSLQSGLSHLFPDYSNTPTPLQKYCDEMTLSDKPQLWILEDVTGAGKTEAALTLSSRIISSGLAEGVFVALPTMATSNAMYDRMSNVYYRLFNDNEKPSLVLTHGSRHLSDKFRESYRDHIISDYDNRLYDENIEEGKIHCARWLADSSKKTLLADAGVGTIDQLLLGVLPARYQSLRYYGMCRKVIIVDEVHSYDPYMLRILETVLTGQASSGGSVILLSATLPFKIRQRLVQSFKEGLGEEFLSTELKERGYPLVTGVVAGHDIVEHVVPTRREVERTVKIVFIESVVDAIDIIKKTVSEERCVCWLRNTVKDVFNAYDMLASLNEIPSEKIDVFHSRFTLKDRIEIEKKIIKYFGNDSGYVERNGRVLLATQVVEQSLDLDFDVLITDLAPIDLLIQRAGRLHRHVRDEKGNRIGVGETSRRPHPVLYIHIPPDTSEPKKSWYSETFKGASYVYHDHSLLWRTKEILKKTGSIAMPGQARLLIESVYGENPIEAPEVFNDSESQAWEKELSRKDMADFNVLKLSLGYSAESSSIWNDEERVPTRLGDVQQTVYLYKIENNEIVPLYSGEFAWEMSSLKVRKGILDFNNDDQDLMNRIHEMKKKYKLSLNSLFLSAGGTELNADGSKILYDRTIGLYKQEEDK